MTERAKSLFRKTVISFRKKGIRKTGRRIVRHINRKASEKRYVREMMPSQEQLAIQRETVWKKPVLFSVVVPLFNTPLELLKETVASVRNQSYPYWELCLADGSDADHEEVGLFCRNQATEEGRIRYQKLNKNEGISGNTNEAINMATGTYIALFDHDDLLMPNALYEMAMAIGENDADFLYSDEMIFASPNTHHVLGIRFKPDFAPEDLLTNNYICHLTVFRKDLLEQAGRFRSEFDGSQDHDLVLRLTSIAERIVHIPKVLYLWRSIPGSVATDVHMKEYAISAGRRAVEDFLWIRGETDASVKSSDVFPTLYRIQYPINGNPSVLILLDPLRETGDWPDKLRKLREKTAWGNCRWEVLDRKTEEGDSRCCRFTEAIRGAEEDYLLFVDGIPEADTADWVNELLMWAQRKEIGAAGAKMRFADGMDLRHTGIVLGLGKEGTAGRPYYDREDDNVGFFGQLAVTRDVSAVTDCWMVERKKFEQAGGFDLHYNNALFDIDLCLTFMEKGFRNIWIPYACLRGGNPKDFCMDAGKEYDGYEQDRAYFQSKWDFLLKKGDPFYNPNLSLLHEDWRIKK